MTVRELRQKLAELAVTPEIDNTEVCVWTGVEDEHLVNTQEIETIEFFQAHDRDHPVVILS